MARPAGAAVGSGGVGLEELVVPLMDNGAIKVNDNRQTIYPNIYAFGCSSSLASPVENLAMFAPDH